MDDFDDFNKPSEIAKALKVGIKAVRAAIKRQEIPSIKVGRAHRIPGSWLRQCEGRGDTAAPSE